MDVDALMTGYPGKISHLELYNLASGMFNNGDRKNSEKIWNFLIDNMDKIRPRDIGAIYFKLGELERSKGNREKAAVYFRECVDRIPYHFKARQYLGEFNKLARKWERFEEQVNKAISAAASPVKNYLLELADKDFSKPLVNRGESLFRELAIQLETANLTDLARQTGYFYFDVFQESSLIAGFLTEIGLKQRTSTGKEKQEIHRVSIVIPCYNNEDDILRTLKSLTNQTYKNFEIIVVNDGSTDNTLLLIEAFRRSNPDIRLTVYHQDRSGPNRARNWGIEQASGPLIVTLDADDQLAFDYLEKTVSAVTNHPEVDVVYTETIFYGVENGKSVLFELEIPGIYTRNFLNATALFKKECWESVGGYQKEILGYEDWEFWISLAKSGCRFKKVHEPLFFYYRRGNTRNFLSAGLDLQKKIQIMEHHPDLYQLPKGDEISILKENPRYIAPFFLR